MSGYGVSIDATTGEVLISDEGGICQIRWTASGLLAAAILPLQAGVGERPSAGLISEAISALMPGDRDPSFADMDVFQAEVKEWAYKNFGAPSKLRDEIVGDMLEQIESFLAEAALDQSGANVSIPAGDAFALMQTAKAFRDAPLDAPSYRPLIGMVEELGELAHAHLKGEQGVRLTPEEVHEKKIDALGDVLVYMADYMNREGLSFYQAIERAWGEVRTRDWKENPLTAGALSKKQQVPAIEGATT